MTASFGIESFLIVMVTSLPPFAVTARITASISDGFCCYFAVAVWENRGFRRVAPVSLAVFGGIISGISQAGGPTRLTRTARRASGRIVVDLSRPACGHVKEALKGREF
jgi:hypothetical protein